MMGRGKKSRSRASGTDEICFSEFSSKILHAKGGQAVVLAASGQIFSFKGRFREIGPLLAAKVAPFLAANSAIAKPLARSWSGRPSLGPGLFCSDRITIYAIREEGRDDLEHLPVAFTG